MHSILRHLLVTATCLVSVCTAIRVDWNTNKGPIVPPTPTTTVRPVPPFREPAPVWVDLSNDIPNPNPYIYIPPLPSRPKQRLNTNINYNSDGNNNYGTIVTQQNAANFFDENNNSIHVASLSPQYLPTIDTKYVAVVTPKIASAGKYPQQISTNAISPDDKTSYKLHGKYNLKTKKYKAFEKAKYVPNKYHSILKGSDTTSKALQSLGNKQYQDELPWKEMVTQFNTTDLQPTTNSPVNTTSEASNLIPIKMSSKLVHIKDAKVKFNKPVDKAKKS